MNIDELNARLSKLVQRFDNLQITGPGWSGNAREGFAFRPPTVVEVEAGGGVGGGPITPPTPTGACCHTDHTCTIETNDGCAALGGAYMGDGTDCGSVSCGCIASITGFSIRAQGAVCCTTSGGSNTQIFDIVGSGNSGTASNLGVDLNWSVVFTDNFDGTYDITWNGTLTNTGNSCSGSVLYNFGQIQTGLVCGAGGSGTISGPRKCSGGGNCSSAFCGAGTFDYLWLFGDVGLHISAIW